MSELNELTGTVFVAGHKGMVGSAIVDSLRQHERANVLTADRAELDLRNQTAVADFFAGNSINHVVIAAAKVGGIHANFTYPAEFIYDNIIIQTNVIDQAWKAGVKNLLFLGSSCIYPRHAAQPMKEAELLTGVLEPTNEPYAIAKIAGIKMCESYNRQYGTDYRSVMPTNLYGPNDNFHPENSHVIPALMQRFHEAKLANVSKVVVWGSGNAKREFLHVEDMAAACVHVMSLDKRVYAENTEPMLSHINVGTGLDVSIGDLAEAVKEAVGYQGSIVFDSSKPDGTPRKLLDVSKLASCGWHHTVALDEGLKSTYSWFLEHESSYRQ
ncbi:MAG: GDP-L-fucose synthase [Pseudomonadales bacterium]